MKALVDCNIIIEILFMSLPDSEYVRRQMEYLIEVEISQPQVLKLYITDLCLKKIRYWADKIPHVECEAALSQVDNWFRDDIIEIIDFGCVNQSRTSSENFDSALEQATAMENDISAIITKQPENFTEQENYTIRFFTLTEFSDVLAENLKGSNSFSPESSLANDSTNEVDPSTNFDSLNREWQETLKGLAENLSNNQLQRDSVPPNAVGRSVGKVVGTGLLMIISTTALSLFSVLFTLEKLQFNNPSAVLNGCNNLRVIEDKILADCRRLDGSFKKATIDIPGLENIDGNLEFTSLNHPSTFHYSCHNPRVIEDKILADCARLDGSFKKAMIDLPDLENIDGNLEFTSLNHFSTHHYSCNNPRVIENKILADCRRLDGSFKKTMIDLFDLENIDGNLELRSLNNHNIAFLK